ncbi:hypothetical protein [Bifidobacterium imperatoris]|uniref:Uncharacterized protein n=1 Tax=Bifidobacterium imperatoris TaxID=2020965 RepID=A0A2N5IQH3_9BIFI|nr:hypothetical protein [Bifidobacterium imperatoris]PLS24203.1 hypothetical protein Tam1G_1780 [Bifidobacterium imperatoris]
MTVELITGFAGTPHINSDDIGAFQAGIVGPGDYALATGNQLKATMSNANTIAVQSGDAVLNGRHVHLTGTTTATVQSGTQGQKRNDKVVLRYTKNTTTGVETCSLVVIKGTNATGTPADPAHNTGSILDGVTTHDMPLYRIPIDGITVGTLVPLFNVLKPMKDVWDSLTHYGFSRSDGGVVKGVLQPNAVTVQNTKWAHAFAETPTVVGWYANDNIYSCAIGSVTTTGCSISIKNVGEQANGIEGHVYAVAYGKLE